MASNSIYELIDLPADGTEVSLSIQIKNGNFGTTSIQLTGEDRKEHEGDFTLTTPNSDTLDGKEYDFNIVCSDAQNRGNGLKAEVAVTGLDQPYSWTLTAEGTTYTFFGTIKFTK